MARRPSLSWVHVGLPNHATVVTPSVLAPFDLIVTIGRTVLLAAAMGKPCLILDVHGCDGLLDADNFAALAAKNFSGRLHGASPSDAQLEELVLRAAADTLQPVVDAVWRAHRLSDRVCELEVLYRRLTETGPRIGDHAGAYGRLGECYANLMASLLWSWREAHQLRGRADAAETRVKELGERLVALERT